MHFRWCTTQIFSIAIICKLQTDVTEAKQQSERALDHVNGILKTLLSSRYRANFHACWRVDINYRLITIAFVCSVSSSITFYSFWILEDLCQVCPFRVMNPNYKNQIMRFVESADIAINCAWKRAQREKDINSYTSWILSSQFPEGNSQYWETQFITWPSTKAYYTVSIYLLDEYVLYKGLSTYFYSIIASVNFIYIFHLIDWVDVHVFNHSMYISISTFNSCLFVVVSLINSWI